MSSSLDLTKPLRDAIAEAEELIANAPFIRTEQDRLEGYEYLAGRIRMAMQTAFDYDLERPLFVNPTHQFSRQGLDNPDALYFNAFLREGVEYVVRGRRGTTADLSFQVMAGTYGPGQAPRSCAAFDDRELDIADDGTFEFRYTAEPGATTLIVREVFNDWDTEERGVLWIERPDTMGRPAAPLTEARLAKRYEVAARSLVGSIQTWFAFPHFFQYQQPVNTLTPPQTTPGGLASQRSSIGHYELGEDQALVITVPECTDCAYQAVQIGSDWYVSTDYETHQTSLTKAQAVTDPDGMMRFVVSERPPSVPGGSIANWLETTGHRTGSMMLRWQRLERDLGPEDGPSVEVVPFDSVRDLLPHHSPVTPEEYAARIAARQRSVARRMLS
ncbi:hypothetical protein GGQ22_17310 [Nocardioides sp. zg-579]|uniref:DUF1214 domain-containing protein n=1 Tax=Nocardioides marmotae TaxID=2663857 RepID=A0A6I3JFD4_9ACTN|nr:hypothetical protein [Nocardioides marmotae]MCR6033182.1 hypothetical protein [Gordonia jinghuaiqii]MTB96837.1 hypothetical protein [Nocardioides marmotae]QKE02963.1 hypothetical protein HPC71_19300 [Nocardioides marmotae]